MSLQWNIREWNIYTLYNEWRGTLVDEDESDVQRASILSLLLIHLFNQQSLCAPTIYYARCGFNILGELLLSQQVPVQENSWTV